jgi:hypothetical protein
LYRWRDAAVSNVGRSEADSSPFWDDIQKLLLYQLRFEIHFDRGRF